MSRCDRKAPAQFDLGFPGKAFLLERAALIAELIRLGQHISENIVRSSYA